MPEVFKRHSYAENAVASHVRSRVSTYPFDERNDPRQAEKELGDFAFRWALAILQSMGVMRESGESYDADELKERLHIAPKHHRYWDTLLRRFARRKVLDVAAGRVTTTALAKTFALQSVETDVAAFVENFSQRYPGSMGLLNFVTRCLGHYQQIITGRINTTEVVFQDGDMEAFGAVFHDDAVAQYFNNVVAEAVLGAIEQLQKQSLAAPEGTRRVIRILEIGAGTGGTTAAILQAIDARSTDASFCFTDISSTFIRYGRRRFGAEYPWVDYRTLNIETDLSQQGFASGCYDIVVAANVLHDTRNIQLTLQQARSLLSPGGLLVLNEFTFVKECLYFSGGLLHGPWLFEDPDKRIEDFCLLSVPKWISALELAEFRVTGCFTLPTQQPDEGCTQGVLLAEAPATESTLADQEREVRAQLRRGPAIVPAMTSRPAVDTSAASAGAEEFIASKVQAHIGIILGPRRIAAYSATRPLMEQGFDSLELGELRGLLKQQFGIKLSSVFLFEHETQEKITKALSATLTAEQLLRARGTDSAADAAIGIASTTSAAEQFAPSIVAVDSQQIAIVGVACRFPGGAVSPAAFWKLLERGGHGIGDMPEGRWQWPPFIDTRSRHKGIDKGGFLERIDDFDALFFRISPKEAKLMDPQQRLLLELSWEAIEDAGYKPSALSGHDVGVFAGVCNYDYRDVLLFSENLSESYVGSGSALSMLANRLSYFYDFTGPSTTVDTACSSSLVALHEAVGAIRRGDCTQALVGAVNLLCSPTNSVAYYQAGMLSPTGTCKTFDDRADGYVRGEGGAMMLLKPLAKALADHDAIYGLIKGSAVNHGGQASTLTAPKPQAQAALIEQAFINSGVAPDSVHYMEAHGTGTKLGDPIEAEGLINAFRRLHQAQNRDWPTQPYCALGSVKSNLGHLEAAAGLAGLLKVLLSMQHGVIPKTLNFERLNPDIDFAGTPFFVAKSNEPWKRVRDANDRELPRRAGVSSFGFGGANAHVVVEEYRHLPRAVSGETKAYVIPMSAQSAGQLQTAAERLLEFLERQQPDSAVTMRELAYTLQVGRESMQHRVAFLVDSDAQLQLALRQFVAGKTQIVNAFSSSMTPASERAPARDREPDIAGFDPATLASTWARGSEVDWRKLYVNMPPPRRAHLPTYSFARKGYWVDIAVAPDASEAVRIHPLLHRNTSDLRQSSYSSTFTGDEFFLAAHVIHGAKVLPAAAHLEMMRAAVEAADGDARYARIALLNVVWSRPAIVADRPLDVHIGLRLSTQDTIEYEIYSGAPPRATVYSHGQALRPAALDAHPHLALNALQKQCNARPIQGDECYDALAAIGLQYGAAHQGLREVWRGVGVDDSPFLLARIALPDVVAVSADYYVAHPSVLDAALQATMLLASSPQQNAQQRLVPVFRLPFALRRLDVLGRCPPSAFAYVRASTNSSVAHDAQAKDEEFDIDLCDEDGRVCLQLCGLLMRVVEQASRTDALELAGAMRLPESLAGEIFFAPAWKPVAISYSSPPAHGVVIVIGGASAEHAAVRQQFPHAEVLALEAINDPALFQSRGSMAHLVWIVSRDEPASLADESIVIAQDRGALLGFRLVKALLAQGYDSKPLTWTVITTQSQAVSNNETAIVTHAGVHGLMGVVAKEFPQWQVRLVDVPSEGEWPSSVFALPCDPSGNCLAYRNERWFRQELTRYQPLMEAYGFEPNAVYIVIGGAGGLGRVFSEELLRRGPVQLVWIGRRLLDDTIQAQIDRLAALGSAPLYISADATDSAQLLAVRTTVKRRFGRIDGLIHAAIDVQDRSLTTMAPEEFRAAYAAKVDVCVRLAQVFEHEPLQFVIFFSSINAFAKPPGQANYAAGCVFKDAFATQLAKVWPCRVRVINWGYWGSVGAATAERFREKMTRAGLASIETPEAMRVLEDLLCGARVQTAFVKTFRPFALEGIVVSSSAPSQTVEHDAPTLSRQRSNARLVVEVVTRAELMTRPKQRVLEYLLDRLCGHVCEISGTDPSVLDARSPRFIDARLGEFGMDSLQSTDLRTALRREYDVDISVQLIISEKVSRLVESLYEQLLLQHLTASNVRQDEEMEIFEI